MTTEYQVIVAAATTSTPEVVEYNISRILLYLSFPNGTTTGAKVQFTYNPQIDVANGVADWFDWTPITVIVATHAEVDAPSAIRVINLDSVQEAKLSVAGNF